MRLTDFRSFLPRRWSLITRRSAFSIIETLLVVALTIVLGLLALKSYSGSQGKTDLDGTTKQMAVILRQAQGQSMSQSSNTTWGVYFSNTTATRPFFALISSSSYSTSTIAGRYILPTTLAFVTSTLAQGASLTVSFAPIIGTASASTSFTIYVMARPSLSSTISIASSGEVGF